MRTSSRLNGGVRSYVSILPALFPAIVLLMLSANPLPIKMGTPNVEVSPIVKRIREIYTSQIGVREKPSNSGPQVEKYLKYVGLSKGEPWCAAFVCWVLGEAGISNPRSGWSPALFGQRYVIWDREQRTKNKEQRLSANVPNFGIAASNSIWKSSRCACPPLAGGGGGLCSLNLPTPTSDVQIQTSPRESPSRLATDNWQPTTIPFSNKRPPPNPPSPTTGDIFSLYFPEKGRIAHTGFIDQWDGTWMISVEGNTNVAGSREGDGVYRKRRLVRSIYKVASYAKASHADIAERTFKTGKK